MSRILSSRDWNPLQFQLGQKFFLLPTLGKSWFWLILIELGVLVKVEILLGEVCQQFKYNTFKSRGKMLFNYPWNFPACCSPPQFIKSMLTSYAKSKFLTIFTSNSDKKASAVTGLDVTGGAQIATPQGCGAFDQTFNHLSVINLTSNQSSSSSWESPSSSTSPSSSYRWSAQAHCARLDYCAWQPSPQRSNGFDAFCPGTNDKVSNMQSLKFFF